MQVTSMSTPDTRTSNERQSSTGAILQRAGKTRPSTCRAPSAATKKVMKPSGSNADDPRSHPDRLAGHGGTGPVRVCFEFPVPCSATAVPSLTDLVKPQGSER